MKALKRGGWGKGNKHPSILKKMAPKMGKTRPKAWASLTHCSPPFLSFHLAISKFSPFSNFPLFNSIPLFPFSFIQPVSSIPKFKMESSHQNWHQRRMKWATRLEEVLNDFDALQLFQSWMGVDDDSSEHPLRLHFAIVAFREMLAHSDPRAAQLAREIYNKFLRPKSGLCAFIDVGIRERIGQMLRQNLGQKGGEFPADLFDECLGPLDTFLRKQHALFVTSQEFLDKFNNSLCLDDFPSPSSQKTPTRRPKKQSDSMERPPLTADMLLRSQKEREAMVPANSASQRLFKPVSKFPYIGQTQPSKNDSAVSSAISSEANNRAGGGNYSLRLIRKEQTRINPPLMATFPRLDEAPAFRTESQQSANQFRHDTPEGRQQFADLLFRKLQKVELRHRHEESVKEQIELLNSARQKGAKQSARELIGQSGPELLGDDSAGLDADEELESYYRVNMAADSNSSANSAQQSPLVPISRRMGPRSRGGHGSCSPPPQMLLDWNGQIGGGMSQSCCSANPSTSMHHSTFLAQSQKANRPPIPPSHHQHHFPLNADSNNDRSMLSSFPHFGIATQFSPFCPQQIPCPSTILHQPLHPIVGPHPPPTSMPSLISQSMHLPNSAIPQPKAPSTPLMGVKCKNPHGYCDNDCDTSGIGSMTSATHSGTSAPGSTEQRERQRAAVFRKARELSSGGGAAERQKQQQSTGVAANSSSSGIPRQKVPPQQQSSATGSLPRPTRAALPQQPPIHIGTNQSVQNAQQQSNGGPKMTISYRESGPNGNGVPVVAQIPRRPLTFREFRRFLSISSKDHRQFFFKVSCEDGSAPYQLLLVNDDHATLPIFEGKITAECRATLTDSD